MNWKTRKPRRAAYNAAADDLAEGVAALYTAITGKSVSAEDMACLADRLKPLEH